ncbi:MAG: hypothetical protein WCI11_20570 [Candidatus Methylumidiphilus sp.]
MSQTSSRVGWNGGLGIGDEKGTIKKKNPRQRKLRKCELGKKTKQYNKGCRYILTGRGLLCRMWATGN